jgi:hypothetical protein
MDNLNGGCKPQAMEMQMDEKLIWNPQWLEMDNLHKRCKPKRSSKCKWMKS